MNLSDPSGRSFTLIQLGVQLDAMETVSTLNRLAGVADNSMPGTIRYVEICCQEVGPMPITDHCFIRLTSVDGRAVEEYHGGPTIGAPTGRWNLFEKFWKGFFTWDYGPVRVGKKVGKTSGQEVCKTCVPKSGCPSPAACIDEALERIPKQVEYRPIGPNSNTAAAFLADSCCEGGFPSEELDDADIWAQGWDADFVNDMDDSEETE